MVGRKAVVPKVGAAESESRRFGRLARWPMAGERQPLPLGSDASSGYDGGSRSDEWEIRDE